MSEFYARYRALINFALAIVTILGIGIVKEPGDVLVPMRFGASVLNAVADFSLYEGRWPFFILLLIIFYDVILQLTIRRRALEIVATTAVIRFPLGHAWVSHIDRVQYIRSNRPNVRAYHMRSTALPGGKVPKHLLEVRYQNRREVFKCNPIIVGSESAWDMVETLEKPLPFNLFLPSLPNWFLRSINSRFIVQRRFSSQYLEPELLPEYYFGLIATRYAQKNITIQMVLPNAIQLGDHVKAIKIKDNVVEPLPILHPQPPNANEYVIETFVKSLKPGERMRLIWPSF